MSAAESPSSPSAEEVGQQIRGAELALEAGALLMQSGCPAETAVETVTQVLHGLGLDDVTPTLVGADVFLASGRLGSMPVTICRPIAALGANLSRVSELRQLGVQVATRGAAPAELRAQLDRIARLPPPYAAWQMLLACGITGVAFGRLQNADVGASLIAFVANVAGQLVRQELDRRGLSAAFATGLAAVVAGLIGACGLNLGISHSQQATLIGSIVFLIPGDALIYGLVDVSSGKYLMLGVQRLFTALLLFLTIALGVMVGVFTVGLW